MRKYVNKLAGRVIPQTDLSVIALLRTLLPPSLPRLAPPRRGPRGCHAPPVTVRRRRTVGGGPGRRPRSLNAPAKAEKPVRVACSPTPGPREEEGRPPSAVEKAPGLRSSGLVTGEDIRAGKLKDFRVLIQPGGSGSAQAKALGQEGRERVKEFVKDGGGLHPHLRWGVPRLAASYDWSLHILDAEVVDRALGPRDRRRR